MTVHIRPAHSGDHAFILSLTPRFSEFGPPAWRTAAEIDAANEAALRKALEQAGDGEIFLIAEDEQGAALGFIHLQTQEDYFNGRPYGYISDVAVAAAGQGRGAGKALMAAAEAWSRECGHALLALYVFAANERARAFYESLGYAEEVVKYVKPLA